MAESKQQSILVKFLQNKAKVAHKCLVVTGSVRDGRCGASLTAIVAAGLKARGHAVDVLDLLEANLPLMEKPFHFYKDSQPPAWMQALAARLAAAEAVILVDAEYNHAPTPTMLNFLDHFGPAQWEDKTVGLVNYSAGNVAGARSTYVLRNVVTELNMLLVPKPFNVGIVQDSIQDNDFKTDSLRNSFISFVEEFEWYATAWKNMKTTAATAAADEKKDAASPAAGNPRAMKIALIIGSAREGRMGDRVATAISVELTKKGHSVVVVDAAKDKIPFGVKKPYSWMSPEEAKQAPAILADVSSRLASADALVLVDPEYNHAPSPGILNILDHYGEKEFGRKMVAISTYSGGPVSGARSAFVLRNTCSILGMVSAPFLFTVPEVWKNVSEAGVPVPDRAQRLTRFVAEFEEYAFALKQARAKL